ncbi:MAG TPA: porin [Vicinamibacterales bacterium]|jgi:phosphate-selective porin OprO/OprP|nr:porin [Vicinamibacterales bacterium]
MISIRHVAVASATAAALMGPASRPALAQTTAAAQSPVPAPIQAGFQDGFFVQSADGNNRLNFGMVAQTDGRFDTDAVNPITNTFTLRKIRPSLNGRVARYFDFKVTPDFGGGTTVIQDAYFDIRFSPKFRVRIGKDKTPIGYELLETDAYLLFPERSLASSLIPNRDIGVQVQGDLSSKVFYAAGLLNGVPDGASTTTELDTNNAKDLAGRIVVQPFRSSQVSASPLNGLGLALGGSHGNESGALPSFKTSIQQTYFSYATTATASGEHHRVTPALFYYYKSFGGFAEYATSSQAVAKAGVGTRVVNDGWDVTTSFLVTGDTASYGLVRPKNAFDPANHHWGALQLLARVSRLTVDADAFSSGLTAAGASRQATQATAGANWYLSQFVKIYGTYERTAFDAASGRATEHTVLFRTQLAF